MTAPLTSKFKKQLSTGLSALTLAAMVTAATTSGAAAHDWRHHHKNHGHFAHQFHQPHVAQKPPRVHKKRRNDTGAAIAAGIIGLAAGAVILGALNQNRRNTPVYHAPRQQVAPQIQYNSPQNHTPQDYAPQGYQAPTVSEESYPRVVEYNASSELRPEPWTAEWYSYCKSKYRSFNPNTGRFLSYSGKYKLCR